MRSFISAGILAAALLAAIPAAAENLAPPTPDGVSVHVAADQNGGAVSVTEGEAIAVELQSSPSTGSSWRVAGKPDGLGEAEQVTGPVIAAVPGAPPRMGAPRWQVFVFPAVASGEGVLTIEKRGPGAGAVLETFTLNVTIEARAD